MLSVCIQAGGASTRMGADKALMLFNGKPLVDRLLERFLPIADEIFIISNIPQNFSGRGVTIYRDIHEGIGALGGLHSALTHARYDLLALIACDLPFANPSMISWMAELMANPEIAAVYPKPNGFFEPVHAVYRPSICLPLVENVIARGERRLISWMQGAWVEEIPGEVMARFDPLGRTFFNVNTPEDFYEAELLDRQNPTG